MTELIDVNLDDVDAWGEPMPEGTYKVKVNSAGWKKKEGGEYPYIALDLSPTEGDKTNRHVFLNLSMHPKALGNMKAFFVATKMPTNMKASQIVNNPEIPQMLTGRECRVTVGIEDTGYGPRNNVKTPYHVA